MDSSRRSSFRIENEDTPPAGHVGPVSEVLTTGTALGLSNHIVLMAFVTEPE